MKTFTWIILCAHKPWQDPRIEWITKHMPEEVRAFVLGCTDDRRYKKQKNYNSNNYEILILNKTIFEKKDDRIPERYRQDFNIYLTFLKNCLDKVETNFAKSTIEKIINLSYHFCKIILNCKDLHGIIACDFAPLPSAIIAKKIHGIPVIYDAHEYFSEENINFSNKDKKILKKIEKFFINKTSARFIVSPQLAELAKKEGLKKIRCLPNAEPI